MSAILFGIVVAGLALALALFVVWARWRVRDRRRRLARLRARRLGDALDDERVRESLSIRADRGGAPTLSPARRLLGPDKARA